MSWPPCLALPFGGRVPLPNDYVLRSAIAMPAVTVKTPSNAALDGISPSRNTASTVVMHGTAAVNNAVS